MNLHMMRDINAGDALPGLGPRVTPAPTPAPQPVRRPDGIVVGPDGKLSTDFPPPPPEPSWPFPTGTAAPAPEPIPEPEPGAHGFMRIRVLPEFRWLAPQIVTAERHPSIFAWTIDGGKGAHGKWWFFDDREGKTWERVA